MIEHSSSIVELCKALHGAQSVLTGVVKDSKNPHFKNRYASLEAVLDTARPALQANGLMVTQAPGQMIDGCVEITTMLAHVSGEWLRSTLHVPLVKRDPQGLGSAVTYGCRYALMAALGVPATDDDGEAAMPDRRPDAASARQNSNRIEVTSGRKPVERNSSQLMADGMMETLWKVSGPKVERFLGRDDVKRDLECMDQEDRERVEAFAENAD